MAKYPKIESCESVDTTICESDCPIPTVPTIQYGASDAEVPCIFSGCDITQESHHYPVLEAT